MGGLDTALDAMLRETERCINAGHNPSSSGAEARSHPETFERSTPSSSKAERREVHKQLQVCTGFLSS